MGRRAILIHGGLRLAEVVVSDTKSDNSRASLLFWGLGLSAAAVSLSAGFLPSGASAVGDREGLASVINHDPEQVTGPDSCAECHTNEHEVWMGTAHQADAQTLTRDPEAKRIAAAMGVRRMKTDAKCASCHFTMQQHEGARLRSIAGVSCESCHNAASTWIDPHSKFGPGASTAAEETTQHRADRLAYCDSMGMIRPARLYELGSSCFACHAISDTELIETAGHPVGDGFEFASWSQGDIRHNFIRGGVGENPKSSVERVRVMYLVGAALRLEYACRGAGEGGSLSAVRDAVANLEQINGTMRIAEVARLIEIGHGVHDAAGATAAVGGIAEIGRMIAEREVGSQEQGLDALIPEPRAGVVE